MNANLLNSNNDILELICDYVKKDNVYGIEKEKILNLKLI